MGACPRGGSAGRKHRLGAFAEGLVRASPSRESVPVLQTNVTCSQLGHGRRHPFFSVALTDAARSSKMAHFRIVTNIYNSQFF